MRRTLLGIMAVTLLAGCSVPQAQPARPTTPPLPSTTPAAECPPDGVRFSLGGTDAAMGVRVLNIEAVNCGDEPVTVNGYPGLRLFGEGKEQLDVAVLHGSAAVATVPALDLPPTPVVIAPGESAWAGIVWRNLVTDPTVNATNAVGLDVALSEDSDWQEVPMIDPGTTEATSIDLGNTTKIGVGPWQRPVQQQTGAPGEPPVSTQPPVDDDDRSRT